MNLDLAVTLGAIACSSLGLALLLSRRGTPGKLIGVMLTAVAGGLLFARVPWLDDWSSNGLFYVLAGVTLGSAVATISVSKPIYAAIWFGMSLLGTAGLMLATGAQFVAVGTIIVYAGAILVTFLFVLMLADPKGQEACDRTRWEALVSAMIGSALVGLLTMTLTLVLRDVPIPTTATAETRADGILAEEHVAGIGHALFGPHLIAVEVAGLLLLVALVGAAAIVAHHQDTVGDS